MPATPVRPAHPSTVAANRKRSPSTRSSAGIWKPFSSKPERPSTDCRSMSRKRCGPTSNAAFWPTGSCAPHHPPVHETRPARRHRSRSARRRGARAGGSHRGFGARAHRPRGTHGSAPATGPERSGHRGAYGALVLRFARLFAACGYADRGPGPAGTRTLMPLRSPTGPGLGAPAHCRCRPSFLRAQNAVVGWDPPSPALSDGTAGEAGGSGSPAPVSSPTLLRGPGAPGPGPRPHRAGPEPVAEPAAADGSASATSCGHRLGWAALLARVFGADLSECAACGGRLRIIAALTDPTSIRTYLEGVGLPGVPPPRAPPQPQLEFAA